jgi:hypothetical protein
MRAHHSARTKRDPNKAILLTWSSFAHIVRTSSAKVAELQCCIILDSSKPSSWPSALNLAKIHASLLTTERSVPMLARTACSS